jgi:protein-disulfide isomerase
VRAEVESAGIRDALAANIALARSYHVDRTPTMLINGHMELGALEFREWEAKLAEARATGSSLAIGRTAP